MERHAYDTMVEALNDLAERGFTIDFNMKSDGVYCRSLDKHFKPEDFKIAKFYRFEGASDPGDQSILYALETNSGDKGVLVDGYGIYSDPLSFEMIQKHRTH